MGRSYSEAYRPEEDRKEQLCGKAHKEPARGRPLARWENKIKKIASPNWAEIAKDRT
ncbi:jg26386, partial [Pararge aegeria aegeria]